MLTVRRGRGWESAYYGLVRQNSGLHKHKYMVCKKIGKPMRCQVCQLLTKAIKNCIVLGSSSSLLSGVILRNI